MRQGQPVGSGNAPMYKLQPLSGDSEGLSGPSAAHCCSLLSHPLLVDTVALNSPHPHPSQAFFVPCFGNFSLRLFSLVIYYYTSMCLIYPVSPTKMSAPGGWGPPVTATAVPHPTIMPGSCQMLNWVLNDQVNTGSLVTSTTQPRQG